MKLIIKLLPIIHSYFHHNLAFLQPKLFYYELCIQFVLCHERLAH